MIRDIKLARKNKESSNPRFPRDEDVLLDDFGRKQKISAFGGMCYDLRPLQ